MPIVVNGKARQPITFEEQKKYCKIINCSYSLRCICTGQLQRTNSLDCKLLLDYVLLQRGIIKPMEG